MNAPQIEFAEDVKIVEAQGIKTERVSKVGFINLGNCKEDCNLPYAFEKQARFPFIVLLIKQLLLARSLYNQRIQIVFN